MTRWAAAQATTIRAGAAVAAGIGAGVWSGTDELTSSAASLTERTFSPAIGDAERAARGAKWARAVECSLNWA